MTELLPPLAQAFLIPIAILFAGLCASNSPSQKIFISVIGIAFSASLFLIVKDVPAGIPATSVVGLLSIFLAAAWLACLVAQLIIWIASKRKSDDSTKP